MQTQYSVVVPAAGVGKRMQSKVPKQYLQIDGSSLLETTLKRLISHPNIVHIYLVLHPLDEYFADTQLDNESWITRIDGGEERVDSVLRGLKQVKDSWVLVHDAARPCVTHDDIDSLLALRNGGEGGLLACKVRDTMKLSHKEQQVQTTAPRENLWHALTPQFFPTQQLVQAIESALSLGLPITDEASAMEFAKHPVHLVAGRSSNLKITTPDDLAIASYYLTQQRENFL